MSLVPLAEATARAPDRQEVLPGLAGLGVRGFSAPALADVDGDDDLDAIVRGTDDVTNTHHRYENIGSTSAPSYVEVTGTANPFTIAEVGGATAFRWRMWTVTATSTWSRVPTSA